VLVVWCRIAIGWLLSLLAHSAASFESVQTLTAARLQTPAGSENVTLPHALKPGQFRGELLSYVLQVDVAQWPAKPWAIYIPKMALSGRVYVNGQYLGACGLGPLEKLRCMHRPYVFTVPMSFWHVGRNEIRVDIYTDATEINGLSSLEVGEAHALTNAHYRFRYWVTVDLLYGLTWLSALLGILSLSASWALRPAPLYFWFGTTSLVNALANMVWLMDFALFDPPMFTFWVSASRFLSVACAFLMYLQWFGKLTPLLRFVILKYSLFGTLWIELCGADPRWLALLYAPFLIAAPLLIGWMLRWSWQSQKMEHAFAMGLSLLILATSVHDFAKLLGLDAFVSTYLLAYSYTGVILILGGASIHQLTLALSESNHLRNTLEAKVLERSKELSQTYAQCLASELQNSNAIARAQLLKDIHDGFGSQLVTASMQIQSMKMKQEDLGNLLQECIADLYLVMDISSHHVDRFEDVLMDFKLRTSQRMQGQAVQLHWDLPQEPLPNFSKNCSLQIMRITQEGLNNALKHAQAAHIGIKATLDSAAPVFSLEITDDGVGIPAQSPFHRGLKSMKERAQALGGELFIGSQGEGTRILLRLPIQPGLLKKTP
jgi:signal transduction histidine kinase